VKEWTQSQPANGLFQIRGGSFNNVEFGRRCVYDFTVGDEVFSFNNTGFRCCYYPTPVTTCLTYTSTQVPRGITGGANSGTLSSTLDVLAGGYITDLNITTTGTTTDFRDLQFTLTSPGGTSLVVVPFLACSGSPDNWSFTFDDAASGSPCSMLGPPVGNGGTYDPISGSLSTFNTLNSTGTWTLSITDNDATSATPVLSTWSLNICVQQ
jgi:subtilisin-like proprotein convertase family protein